MDNRKYVAVKKTRLTAGITSAATSFTVAEVKDRADNTLTMTDFGSLGFGVFEPGTSKEEHFSFSGISSNTITISARGLAMKSPYTNVAANQKSHGAGTVVVLYTNTPAAWDSFVNKENDETISGTHTYSNAAMPRLDSYAAPTADEEFATKKYADDLAIAGAPDSTESVKGIVEKATSAESQAGTDSGSTTAPLFAAPSDIAVNAQNQQHTYAADSGAADAYVITLAPVPSAYVSGQKYTFKATNASTGASTLNVNALGAKTIKKLNDQDVEANDIEAGHIIEVVYDGTNFQMQTPLATQLTAAQASEIAAIVDATDITGAQLETLSDGSNADTEHAHNSLVPSFQYSFSETAGHADNAICGYHDGDGITLATTRSATGGGVGARRLVTGAFNGAPIIKSRSTTTHNTVNADGVVHIGTALWTSNDSPNIRKNSTNVTFSGDTGYGPLSYDATNAYLLVLDTSTTIHRYSGVAGSTITYVDEVTLDNAVDTDKGFIFDDTNDQYICVDGSDIRVFDSSGTTVSATAFTDDSGTLIGVVLINSRVYLVHGIATTAIENAEFTLVPTSVTI
jgi:hypothetical protein